MVLVDPVDVSFFSSSFFSPPSAFLLFFAFFSFFSPPSAGAGSAAWAMVHEMGEVTARASKTMRLSFMAISLVRGRAKYLN